MSFSYNDFVKAKKKGLIAWDEDLINSFSQQTNDAAKSTEELRPRDFDENKKKVTDLEQNRQYVQTYIDSLKGSEGYDAAKKSFDSVNDSFNKTKGFYDQFKDRKAYDTYVGESYLQGKQVKSELIRAASQAEIAGYEKRYEGKTYKELKAAAASAKDEKEKSRLNKQAEEKSSAQEYYNDNIAGIEKKKAAATARIKTLDEQYRSTKYSTPPMQNEYSDLKKQVEKYDSLLTERNKVYKKKVSKEAENEERKISARYAHKYEGKTVSDLLEARKTVEGESESEWLKNKILNNTSYDELSSLKESMKKTTDSDLEGFSDFNSYYFYGDNTGLSKNQKAKYGITAEEIDSALEQKGEEKYYNDILKKDTKAITKVQRYYALKNGKIGFKSDGSIGETGGNDDVVDS